MSATTVPPTAILASRDKITIRELAFRWSGEIGVPWPDLERFVFEAGLAGEFDAMEDGHGLFVFDPESRLISSTCGRAIREKLKCLEADGGAREFLEQAHAQEWFGMHRDAVLAFAVARALPPPSWWRSNSDQRSTPGTKTRGPHPLTSERVKAEMRRAVANGFDLQNTKGESLAVEFRAARSTCKGARDAVLAEIAENNSDK